MSTTATRTALDLPLYASKPRRRISGTDLIAVTMYASSDKTVRQYAIFTADGQSLGTVYYGKATRSIYRGSEYRHTASSASLYRQATGEQVAFGNLADAALALVKATDSDAPAPKVTEPVYQTLRAMKGRGTKVAVLDLVVGQVVRVDGVKYRVQEKPTTLDTGSVVVEGYSEDNQPEPLFLSSSARVTVLGSI